MYQLQKSFRFEASHQLMHHEGKCRRLHGHSYTLTVQLEGAALQKAGSSTNMLCDFQDVSNVVKPLIQTHLDHNHLNDSLETDSPTAEFIAKWVYDRIRPKLRYLDAVMVQETASSVAVYQPRATCCRCRCHNGVKTGEEGVEQNGLIEQHPTIEQNGAMKQNGTVGQNGTVERNGAIERNWSIGLNGDVEQNKLLGLYESGEEKGITTSAVKCGIEMTTDKVADST